MVEETEGREGGCVCEDAFADNPLSLSRYQPVHDEDAGDDVILGVRGPKLDGLKDTDREGGEDEEDEDDHTLMASGEEMGLFDPEWRPPNAGFMSSFLNMANSIIGAGIIGLPFAFRESGFWSGVFLLFSLTVVIGEVG